MNKYIKICIQKNICIYKKFLKILLLKILLFKILLLKYRLLKFLLLKFILESFDQIWAVKILLWFPGILLWSEPLG